MVNTLGVFKTFKLGECIFATLLKRLMKQPLVCELRSLVWHRVKLQPQYPLETPVLVGTALQQPATGCQEINAMFNYCNVLHMLDFARNVQHMKKNSFVVHHLFLSPWQLSQEPETKLVSLDDPQVTFIQYAVFPRNSEKYHMGEYHSHLVNPNFFFSLVMYK